MFYCQILVFSLYGESQKISKFLSQISLFFQVYNSLVKKFEFLTRNKPKRTSTIGSIYSGAFDGGSASMMFLKVHSYIPLRS